VVDSSGQTLFRDVLTHWMDVEALNRRHWSVTGGLGGGFTCILSLAPLWRKSMSWPCWNSSFDLKITI
jgi:hypothetical protein